MKSKEFIKTLANVSTSKRELLIQEALEKDYVPEFLTHFKPIEVHYKEHTLIYFVSPDYLSIGENDDFIRMPMWPMTAKNYMRKYNLCLPTPRMVDQIYHAENSIKILPQTYNPKSGQPNRSSTAAYVLNNEAIQKKTNNFPLDSLFVGHSKDVVLVNSLLKQDHKNNLCIYGWFQKDGTVIQGLNYVRHSKTYVDYSQRLRMVKKDCILDGRNTTLDEILDSKDLCNLVHPEPLKFKEYV